jgi:hypothetical protein
MCGRAAVRSVCGVVNSTATEATMSYVHVTKSPGITMADYARVREHLGASPIKGQRSHYAGESAGALHVVDVWESKADADRFAAERLFPAFEGVGIRPGADQVILGFEVDDQ